jgi:hypothetical protein
MCAIATTSGGDSTQQALEARGEPLGAQVEPAPGSWTITPANGAGETRLILHAPDGHWDLAKFARLVVTVRNDGAEGLKVEAQAQSLSADGSHRKESTSAAIKVGASADLTIDLAGGLSPLRKVLFGMRGYPGDEPGADRRNVDPSHVTLLSISLGKLPPGSRVAVSNLRAIGAAPVRTPDGFFPFVDTFGQYMHAQWPGKLKSDQELLARRDAEARELAAATAPEGWNAYGGWAAGPQLKATGFFRTEKHNGKWWLVDPQGRLFFSHGVDCVRFDQHTPVDERDKWFAEFAGNDPAYAEFFLTVRHVVRDHYKDKSPRSFSFSGANLRRKYGADWKTLAAQTDHLRFRSWGLNTIGNWSVPGIYMLRKTPYVATLNAGGRPIAGSTGFWGQFRDPFDPQFAQSLRNGIAQAGKAVGDPWCIGFFVDNELSWGDDTSLARAAMVSPADQPAKIALVDELKAKYATIQKLNEAWATSHASWEALLQGRQAPDAKRAGDDLRALYARNAQRYFEVVRSCVKEAAPDQLYLGCRFAWSNPTAVKIAAKSCDVVSFNRYARTLADFKPPIDMPAIIGEFHFGALDRGMFHTGLVPVKDQAARAQAYADYVNSALDHPLIVGTHWFQYRDQPLTGRSLDGENFQIGLVDVTDTPYPETVAAVRQVARGMYARRGK